MSPATFRLIAAGRAQKGDVLGVARIAAIQAAKRTPELIPGQVRLLRSLLIGREPTLDKVILASETDGTYTVKPTPRPSATPAP